MTIEEKLEQEDILYNLFKSGEINFYQLLEKLNKLYVNEHKIEL